MRCGVGLGLLMWLAAGPGQALGLVAAWEQARLHDPTYRAAVHAGQAGQESVALGRAGLLPSVSAAYAGSRNRSDIARGDQLTHPAYSSRAASVSLRQALFNLDALARYRQGQAQGAGSAALVEAAAQALILRVTGAYIDVLFSDDQAALAMAARDALGEQDKVNARLFEQGEGTRTDMLETAARRDLAEARLLEAEDGRRAARATLAAMIGVEVDQLEPLAQLAADGDTPEAAPEPFARWRTAALAANPELRVAQASVAQAEAESDRARAAHLPRLDLVADYARNGSETVTTLGQESTVRSVGLQFNVPLLSGGAASAAQRQAAANALRAGAERDERQNTLLLELRKDYDALVSSAARIAALSRKLPEMLVKDENE